MRTAGNRVTDTTPSTPPTSPAPSSPLPPLGGDAKALAMACPPGPAAALAAELPPGPVLELCCGVGGLTRELARTGRQVLAVDRSPARLQANRANLAAAGLAGRVSHLCRDLRQPAPQPPPGEPPFAVSILDPDWSAPGDPPHHWAASLRDMEPPVPELVHLALSLSPLAVLRLPREVPLDGLDGLPRREVAPGGRRWYWLALGRG